MPTTLLVRSGLAGLEFALLLSLLLDVDGAGAADDEDGCSCLRASAQDRMKRVSHVSIVNRGTNVQTYEKS